MRDFFFEASHRALTDTSPLEECLVHLEQLDEKCRDALVALEVNKRRVKV